jgi:hypothetical protein
MLAILMFKDSSKFLTISPVRITVFLQRRSGSMLPEEDQEVGVTSTVGGIFPKKWVGIMIMKTVPIKLTLLGRS